MGVQVVNIGSRQSKRERGGNVFDVEYQKNQIQLAIKKTFNNENCNPEFIYGGGDAGEKIADLLCKLPLYFHKTLTF
jgi:hypothetical protein